MVKVPKLVAVPDSVVKHVGSRKSYQTAAPGTTTGGKLGSVIDVFGIATGGQGSATAVWHLVSEHLLADGTLATPFA